MWILEFDSELSISPPSVKQHIWPPVPGPKIRGVDFQRLKVTISVLFLPSFIHIPSYTVIICNYSCQTLQDGGLEDFNTLFSNQKFPLMEAWKDRADDYLIVTETDKGVLPDRNKNFIIPTIDHVGSQIQHQESTRLQKPCEKVGTGTSHFVKSNNVVLREGFLDAEPSQSVDRNAGSRSNLTPSNPTETSLPDCENTLKPQAYGAYVDIATHTEHIQKVNDAARRFDSITSTNLEPADFMDAQRQAESWSEDYSRVKDVNGVNVVFLETVPVNTTSKENDDIDYAGQETKPAPEPAPKEGRSITATGSGYVDAVTHTAMM